MVLLFVLIIFNISRIVGLCLSIRIVRKPIGDISLHGLGQDWTLRRYILHLNDI